MSFTFISYALRRKKNNPPYINSSCLRRFIRQAILEDRGSGDHTSLATIPAARRSKAALLVKEPGIIAGLEVAREVFRFLDPKISMRFYFRDGDPVRKGDVAFIVQGRARHLLLAERLVLNIMQRMSGIATETAALIRKCRGTGVRILDTRKTTPNFRFAEKWAVRLGGGNNHRFGLYDLILVKDNHIDICGGVATAIRKVKAYKQRTRRRLKIEVEARTLEDVQVILQEGGVHRILLDNMDISQMKRAVKMIRGRAETEASGGISSRNIRKVAKTGVDFISVGALTHQIRSLDLSLKAIKP